jgi:hypothetical protein
MRFAITIFGIFFAFHSSISQYAILPATAVNNAWLSNPFGQVNPYTVSPFPANAAQMIQLSDIKYNYILTVSELQIAGLFPNAVLNSIGFHFYTNSIPYTGLNVSLKHTSANTLGSFDNSNLITVYSGSTFDPSPGWQHIPFSIPFTWNGTQNVLVSICWDRPYATWGNPVAYSNTQVSGRAISNQATSGSGCNLSATTLSSNVPITAFGLNPVISSFSPQSGCTNQNTLITLTGFFLGVNNVTIGGVLVPFNVINNNQMEITSNGLVGIIEVSNSIGSALTQVPFVNNNYPNTPAISSSNSPQCGPVTITRNANPSAGETWYWQGTNPNGTATNLGSGSTYTANSSGTYYLRAVNAAGCWSNQSASVAVVVDPLPNTPTSPNSNSPQCGSVTLSQVGIPQVGHTWYWQDLNSNGSSTQFGSAPTYVANATGTYYLRARNSSGCWSASSSSISVVVNQSPSQPSNPVSNSPQCNAVIVTRLGNPPAGETWYWQGTNPNGISTILGSGVNFTATSTGTYYLRSMTSANCWSNSSASISVVVYSLPSVPATPSSNSPQCASVTVSRSGNPPAGATWYWQGTNPNGTLTNLGAGPTYTANASGTYYIRALNNNNCWSSSSASTAVTVFTTNTGVQSVVACDSFTWVNGVTYTNSTNSPSMLLPNASVFGCDSNLVLNLTVHPTFNTAVTVVSCDTYTWIDGITYSASTSNPSYMLTSQYGCDSLVNLNLTIGYPQFDTTFHNATSIGSYLLNGIEYTQSGIYYQLLQDQFGCDSTVQLNLIVEDAALDETSNASLMVFPNPSHDGLFELQSSKNIEIMEVRDIAGRAVPYQVNGTQLSLNQNSGVYLCIVKYGNSTEAIRLVITP